MEKCVVDMLISVHVRQIVLVGHCGLKSRLQSDVWRFLQKTKTGKLKEQSENVNFNLIEILDTSLK